MAEVANTPLKAKDFASDQDVKWCPGCGDYSILKQVQSTMPEIGVAKEDIVFNASLLHCHVHAPDKLTEGGGICKDCLNSDDPYMALQGEAI